MKKILLIMNLDYYKKYKDLKKYIEPKKSEEYDEEIEQSDEQIDEETKKLAEHLKKKYNIDDDDTRKKDTPTKIPQSVRKKRHAN